MKFKFRYDYDDIDEPFINKIGIRHGACFNFLECTVKLYQLSERSILFQVEAGTIEEAHKKTEYAVGVLNLLLAISINTDELAIVTGDMSLVNNSLLSKHTKTRLEYAQGKISRFGDSKKDLFVGCVKLMNIGMRNYYKFNNEDAFVYYFKVIERIAKANYVIYMDRHHNPSHTRPNKQQLKTFLTHYSTNVLKVKLTDDMMNRKVDILYKEIKEEFYGSVFSKISLFVQNNSISFSENTISKLVKIRNKLAHGDIVDSEVLQTYVVYCEHLAFEMISQFFFHRKYSDIKIPSYRFRLGEDLFS